MSDPEGDRPWLHGRVVLILCGLIASGKVSNLSGRRVVILFHPYPNGKSTFAEQLQQYYPKFHRCNQDDLGDRRQVERLARDTLSRGQSVCIDRTNFNAS